MWTNPAGRTVKTLVTLLCCFVLCSCRPGRISGDDEASYDVVVYGGTSSGVIAAVQVARMGKRVALVCPDRHLGGMTSGGLGWTDTGNTGTIGGLAREFYHAVWQHYQEPNAWTWQSRESYGNRGQGSPVAILRRGFRD